MNHHELQQGWYDGAVATFIRKDGLGIETGAESQHEKQLQQW